MKDWDLGEKVGEGGMGEKGKKDPMRVREGSRGKGAERGVGVECGWLAAVS